MSPTSLGAAVANQLASSLNNCRILNLSAQYIYDTAVRNYNGNISAGVPSVPPLQPPVAPQSWVLTDPDSNGFQTWEQTGPQLVPTPPLTILSSTIMTSTPARDPNHINVGNRISGAWFQVGAGDGTPSGFATPPNTVSADGVIGSFVKFGAPVGPGWYLLSA